MTTTLTPARTRTRTWHSWHLHVHSISPQTLDDVVLRCVDPIVRGLGRNRWFFIRYWQGGPHIRLRIADIAPDTVQHLHLALHRAMAALLTDVPDSFDPRAYERQAAGFAAAGETGEPMRPEPLRDPGVHRAVYEPEFQRYGGVEYMALSEDLFHVSSEVALAVCRQRRVKGQAIGDGLLAMAAGLSVLPDDVKRRVFLENLRRAWTEWGLAALPGYDPDRVAALASTQAARLRAVAAPIAETVSRPGPGWDRWVRPLSSAFRVWAGEAGDELRAGAILGSHVHMMENRLGVGGGREGYLASVLLELLEL
jgi:thiopeptide-type bacteriocin biosynthesis protein